MKHALTQKLAGVAAWKWLAGLTGAIVLYRRFQGSTGGTATGSATPPDTTSYDSGYAYGYDTGYGDAGSGNGDSTGTGSGGTPTSEPLSPGVNPGGPEQPAPAGNTTKPPGKRTRKKHEPAHHKKGHKQKATPGAHRGNSATRKRTSHAKVQPARTRSHAAAHPAVHPKARPATTVKHPPVRRPPKARKK